MTFCQRIRLKAELRTVAARRTISVSHNRLSKLIWVSSTALRFTMTERALRLFRATPMSPLVH